MSKRGHTSSLILVATAALFSLALAGCPASESEGAKRPLRSVPDVIGATQAEAELAIKAAKLSVGAVLQVSSRTVPAGIVIGQEPVPGTRVIPKTPVDLVVSTGFEPPAEVAVPDLTGMRQRKANKTLKALGLSVGTIYSAYSETIPKGRIAAQDPAAGTSVAVGSVVDLHVSLGRRRIPTPDVTGLTQAAAESTITLAGLTVGAVKEAYDETVPAGMVSGQQPPAGTMLHGGSPVDLIVSKGHVPVLVPDLTGKTRSEAEAALNGYGLNVGVVKKFYVDVAPAGVVYSQFPVAGSEAEWESDVKIWVSLGTPGRSWTRLYGTDGSEYANGYSRSPSCAMETGDGGILIASKSVDAAKNSDIYVVKIGPDGAIMPSAEGDSGLWEFVVGWPNTFEEPYAMCMRGDGAYVIAAYQTDALSGAKGVLLWFVQESGYPMGFAFYPNAGKPGSVFSKPDGGLVIAADVVIETDALNNEVARHEFSIPVAKCVPTTDGGCVTLNESSPSGPLVAKYNSQWELIWEQFSTDSYLYWWFGDIAPAPDGGVFVGGVGELDIMNPNLDYWNVALLDASGNTVWSTKTHMWRYGAQSLYSTASGGVLALGLVATDNDDHDDYDLQCVKIDAEGAVEHDWIVGGSFRDRPGKVLEMQDGSYVITGHYELEDHGLYDVYVTKIAPDTPAPWTKTWGPGDFPYSALATDDGGMVGVGLQMDANLLERGLCVKVDHAGNEAWRKVLGDDRWANITFSIGRSAIGGVGATDLTLLGIGKPRATESGSDLFLEAINTEGETLFTREFHTTSVVQFGSWRSSYTAGFFGGGQNVLVMDGAVARGSNQDISLVVLNSQGETILEKTHNAGLTWETDAFCDTGYAGDGGLLLRWSIPDPFDPDFAIYKLIEKLDANLVAKWRFNLEAVASRVQWIWTYKLEDGGMLLNMRARERNPDTGYDELSHHLVKLDENGQEVWRKVVSEEDGAYVNVEVLAYPGGVYVGETETLWTEDGIRSNFVLSALTFSGEERWSRTFDNAYSAQVLAGNSGECLLSYREYSERVPGEGYYTFFRKIDAQGADVWSRERLHDLAGTIVASRDGGYLLYGDSYHAPMDQGYPSMMLTKTDAEGNVEWSSHFGKGEWNLISLAKEMDDGGYWCTSYTYVADLFGNGSTSQIVWYKLDSQGHVLGQPQE
ncbi:MAG: PASTA domain-containing protein [Candidatus Hydrogenedentes bacterium]|nr:PASTA domain-containing protein [Candidatus Hydrogenedentota bacterium]